MFRMLAAAVSGVALLALAPGMASAQEPTDDAKGMSCVYERVSDEDAISIAENYLFGDLSGVDVSALDKRVTAVEQACADDLKLSSEQAGLSREMAVYGLSGDYLSQDLIDMGVADGVIDAVFDYYQSLGEEDLEHLYDAGWRDDATFAAKLKQGIVDAGMPDKKEAIDTAFDIIELAVLSEDAALAYMFADLDDEIESVKE